MPLSLLKALAPVERESVQEKVYAALRAKLPPWDQDDATSIRETHNQD